MLETQDYVFGCRFITKFTYNAAQIKVSDSMAVSASGLLFNCLRIGPALCAKRLLQQRIFANKRLRTGCRQASGGQRKFQKAKIARRRTFPALQFRKNGSHRFCKSGAKPARAQAFFQGCRSRTMPGRQNIGKLHGDRQRKRRTPALQVRHLWLGKHKGARQTQSGVGFERCSRERNLFDHC